MSLKIEATDGAVVVVYEPALTPAMYAELVQILSEPSTKSEIRAVVAGLAEDWQRTCDDAAMLRSFEQN